MGKVMKASRAIMRVCCVPGKLMPAMLMAVAAVGELWLFYQRGWLD